MIRASVLANKLEPESEKKNKKSIFSEIEDFEEIKIGKLDGNSVEALSSSNYSLPIVLDREEEILF